MNLEKVMTLLRSRGLEGIAEACLQFRTQPIQEHELSPGSSKFGGAPELPIEVPWPTWNGWPLDFLLQLDCSEIPPHWTNDLLPKLAGFTSFTILKVTHGAMIPVTGVAGEFCFSKETGKLL